MKLFENRISSAVARVKIALALKGRQASSEEISILGDAPDSRTPEYRRINPQGWVPALVTDEGELLTQSLAIIEYLEERFPKPALLPENLEARAHARAIAMSIAAEVHALVPPRVAARLRSFPGVDPAAIPEWNRHWLVEGMTAVETLLARQGASSLCVGEAPSVADIFLFPQAVNAERAGIGLSQWSRISAVMGKLRTIAAFADNAPAPRD
jgi:maleylpyruvate isomerase